MRIIASKDTLQARQEFRAKRNALLAATDAWMLPDRGLTEDQQAELLSYRQSLRDCCVVGSGLHTWALPTAPAWMTGLPK